jgi:hypothetical protein
MTYFLTNGTVNRSKNFRVLQRIHQQVARMAANKSTWRKRGVMPSTPLPNWHIRVDLLREDDVSRDADARIDRRGRSKKNWRQSSSQPGKSSAAIGMAMWYPCAYVHPAPAEIVGHDAMASGAGSELLHEGGMRQSFGRQVERDRDRNALVMEGVALLD